jgi:PAS domain S-box-containing protein
MAFIYSFLNKRERPTIQAVQNQARRYRIVGEYLLQIFIVFVAYVIAGKLGQATTNIRSSNLGPVWPASGIALAAILICGYRVWPGVMAGTVVVAFFGHVSHITALGQAAGSTLAALTGAYSLHRIANFDRSLSRLSDAISLIVLGGFGDAMVSASIGVFALHAAHEHPYSGVGAAWLIYWLGDATGILLVTPLVLRVTDLLKLRNRQRTTESAVLLILLSATCFLVFGDLPFIPVKLHFMAFAVLPFIIWAAIRLGLGVTALSILIVATIATVETALGSGPFAQNTTFVNAVLLDVFFGVLSITGLSLAAVVGEREHAVRERERLIRERAKAEARLRLATIVESSDDAIIGRDINGIITDWNRAAERLYGYTEPEAVGQSMTILIPPELLEEEDRILEKLRAGERVENYETVRVSKAGSKIDISLSISPLKDSTGTVVGFSGIARDISERKRVGVALRESAERLRLAAQAGRMYAFEWDVTTDVIVRSSEYVNVLGATEPQTLTHRQAMEKIHPDDRPKLVAAVAKHSPENPTVDVTYRILLPGKSPIWVKSSGRAFFDKDGRMLRVIGMIGDITDQKLAEEGLHASEERLRLAQKVAHIGTFERNIRTGINTWTPEMESMYGLPPGGFGQTRIAFENLVHPQDRAEVMKLVDEALKTGQPTNGEWRVVWPDGSVHWIAGRWQVLMDESGEPLRVVGADIDITERKEAEEALADITRKLVEAQEQERARIGRELHDDINQRIAMLAVELEQLQQNPSALESGVQELRKGMTELSNDVQALSHNLHSSRLEYLGVVAGMKSWCKEFAERQKMEIDFRSDVSSVPVLEVGLPLFRVLQEALQNAAKHSGVRRVEVQLREDSGEMHLVVHDSGRGFDIEAAKQGRGLGLTSMRERTRLVNGMISIESKPMGGTTIHVRIPLGSEYAPKRKAV